jgi:hypothetical protein
LRSIIEMIRLIDCCGEVMKSTSDGPYISPVSNSTHRSYGMQVVTRDLIGGALEQQGVAAHDVARPHLVDTHHVRVVGLGDLVRLDPAFEHADDRLVTVLRHRAPARRVNWYCAEPPAMSAAPSRPAARSG